MRSMATYIYLQRTQRSRRLRQRRRNLQQRAPLPAVPGDVFRLCTERTGTVPLCFVISQNVELSHQTSTLGIHRTCNQSDAMTRP